ncbi:MAG: hypothetical protein ACE5JI_00265 [Acidobacteriota bacterium]
MTRADAASQARALKVADEVWIATALLHLEAPNRTDFTITEIVERARREAMTERLRPGVRAHATQHCVANRPPSPGRYRMLFATGKSTRRLYRPGDPYHPYREGAKTAPRWEEIPPKYRHLLDWYACEYAGQQERRPGADPVLGLRGLGREIWQGEDPDEYVRRMREGWK